ALIEINPSGLKQFWTQAEIVRQEEVTSCRLSGSNVDGIDELDPQIALKVRRRPDEDTCNWHQLNRALGFVENDLEFADEIDRRLFQRLRQHLGNAQLRGDSKDNSIVNHLEQPQQVCLPPVSRLDRVDDDVCIEVDRLASQPVPHQRSSRNRAMCSSTSSSEP